MSGKCIMRISRRALLSLGCLFVFTPFVLLRPIVSASHTLPKQHANRIVAKPQLFAQPSATPPRRADVVTISSITWRSCDNTWGIDVDEDGMDDGCEDQLAERFAPIFYYKQDEPNLPTNVDWFLRRTELRFFDKSCAGSATLPAGCRREHGGVDCPVPGGPLTNLQYFRGVWQFESPCGGTFYSDGQYDPRRNRTFYLKDLDAEGQKGSPDPREWITYYHAFPRRGGGSEIQYWRFHPFNTGKRTLFGVELGFHGGDFEGVQVVLNSSNQPTHVRFTHHRDINQFAWDPAKAQGNHVKVLVEKGGHANDPFQSIDENAHIRHQTWRGGTVTWPPGNIFGKPANRIEPAGPLENLGEKFHPMGDKFFIRYAGLWGSIGQNFSGWWGPGYNEGADNSNNYIEGWCGRDDQMVPALRNNERSLVWESFEYAVMRECIPRLTP